MTQQEIIKVLENILGTFAYEYGTDSQSYNKLEKLASDLKPAESIEPAEDKKDEPAEANVKDEKVEPSTPDVVEPVEVEEKPKNYPQQKFNKKKRN